MAAATPRASGLWEYSAEMTYSRLSAHDTNDDSEGATPDSRTPLDKTIDQIGMGAFFLSSCSVSTAVEPSRSSLGTYQWALLFLCGFGA